MLKQIKDYFGSGCINKNGSKVIFNVRSTKGLGRVIEHFYKYPLITQKAADFILFEKAYRLWLKKEHLVKEGLETIVAIKASMNKGISDTLKLAFINVKAFERPNVVDINITDPHWMAGFATGEGCFSIYIHNSKSTPLNQARNLV